MKISSLSALIRPLVRVLALAFLLLSAGEGVGMAQTQTQTQAPDCQLFFNFTAVGQVSGPLANYGAGSVNGPALCDTWTLGYASRGFSAVSLEVQSAPLGASATTAGTFVTYIGTVSSGANPNTSTTGAQTKLSNGTVSIPWIRVTLGSATGSGNVVGILQGWNTGNSGGGGGGGGSGCANPCPVEGVDAAGVAPTVPPVAVSGFDGTNGQRLRTDTTGHLDPSGAATAQVDGASNTPTIPKVNGAVETVPIYAYNFNGVTWDRQAACTNRQAFNLSATTDVVIVTGTAAKTTRLCHVSFANDSAQTFVFRSGTGSTCGTGTTALTGTYGASVNGAFDFGPLSPLKAQAAADDSCLHFGAAVTGGGVAIYAVY